MPRGDTRIRILKESFRKVGVLPIPILIDEKGQIIDGFDRARTGVKLPIVTLPIKNRLQFNIVKLVINGVRRVMAAEEKTAVLTSIAELSGWTPKEMAEKLPFSYEWIMKYLPSDYKNREKAAAGKLGGRPSTAAKPS